MEINAYGTIMFLMGSVVGAVVKTFIEFSIRQHFERKELKRKRKEKKARRKAAALSLKMQTPSEP